MTLFLNRPWGEVPPCTEGLTLLFNPRFFLFFFISPRPLFLHGQSNSGETKSWDGLANRALSKNSLRWYFGFFSLDILFKLR